PAGRRVALRRGSWPVPGVFAWLQRLGNIPEEEMYRVFNMGIGFVVLASRYYAESIQRQLAEEGVPSWVIGEVREGEPGVEWACRPARRRGMLPAAPKPSGRDRRRNPGPLPRRRPFTRGAGL